MILRGSGQGVLDLFRKRSIAKLAMAFVLWAVKVIFYSLLIPETAVSRLIGKFCLALS